MNVTIKPLIVDSETAGKMLGVSKSTIEKLTRERNTTGFPPIRKVSANRAGYRVSELEAWAEARPVSDLVPPPNTSVGGKKDRRGAANSDHVDNAA